MSGYDADAPGEDRTCIFLQLEAGSIRVRCSTFPFRTARCSLLGRTLDPKVASSIPARPIESEEDMTIEGPSEASASRLLIAAADPECFSMALAMRPLPSISGPFQVSSARRSVTMLPLLFAR
jgi:hypothetical protein